MRFLKHFGVQAPVVAAWHGLPVAFASLMLLPAGCALLPLDDVVPTRSATVLSPAGAAGSAGTNASVGKTIGDTATSAGMLSRPESAAGASSMAGGSASARDSTAGKSAPGNRSPFGGAEAGASSPTGTKSQQAPPAIAPGGDQSGVEFVAIPAGTFTMGSPPEEAERVDDEGPQHSVTISSFELGKTEVTNAQYGRFLQANPMVVKPVWWTDTLASDEPVDRLSWSAAQQFAQWIGGRLPTEAEWEYAARAGTTASRYGTLDAVAWYGGSSPDSQSNAGMQPVGQKQANAWELYDMLGNVQEWCSDWYGRYDASPVTNPSGRSDGSARVVRGGDYYQPPSYSRAASRYSLDPNSPYGVGFRVARDRR